MTLTALFLLQEFIVLEILNTLTKNVSQDGANTLSDTFVSCSICCLAFLLTCLPLEGDL